MRGSKGEGKKQKMEEERRGGVVEMIRETAVTSKGSVCSVVRCNGSLATGWRQNKP